MENRFKKILKYEREKGNLKQNQVAIATDIAPQAICQYEKGTRIPGMFSLIKLAKFFRVSVDYLTGYSEETNPTSKDKVKVKMLEEFIIKIKGV